MNRDVIKPYEPPISYEPLHEQASEGSEAPLPHPAAAIQRMKASPESLSQGDIGALHRTLGNRVVQRMRADVIQRREAGPSARGEALPDGLRTGIESLSGMPMDDVRVHYNSSQPRSFASLAYTAGSDIHVGPGEERHLPHEAWHVVQQKQGRVAPSMSIGGIGVNTSASLEREADHMGDRARSLGSVESRLPSAGERSHSAGALGQPRAQAAPSGAPVRQFVNGARTTPKKATKDDILVSSEMEKLAGKKTPKVEKVGQEDYEQVTNFSVWSRKFEVENRKAQQYKINDPTLKFYHATSKKNAKKVMKKGLPLGPSTDYFPMSQSSYMSSGYFYFASDPVTSGIYAEKLGWGAGNMGMFEFTLPEGTVFTRDPEIPTGAFRMKTSVPHSRLKPFRVESDVKGLGKYKRKKSESNVEEEQSVSQHVQHRRDPSLQRSEEAPGRMGMGMPSMPRPPSINPDELKLHPIVKDVDDDEDDKYDMYQETML